MAASKNIFDTWMHKESKIVQQLARVYGERVCHERLSVLVEDCSPSFQYHNIYMYPNTRSIVRLCLTVSLQQVILEDCTFYLLQDAIDKQMVMKLQQAHDNAIKELFKVYPVIVDDGFAIPEPLLYAPIARDWVEYNKYDNRGALISSKY